MEMSDNTALAKSKKRRKSGKKSQKVSFDAETVPKHMAKDLSKAYDKKEKEDERILQKEAIDDAVNKKRDKAKKCKAPKQNINIDPETLLKEMHGDEELDPTNLSVPKEDSRRAKKRKKHQQLLLDKKVKLDLVLQEKSLNYLSRWKYSRSEWKFEKLRQVWLQQNMFECDKVPDRFWDTLVEYFSSALGKVRQNIIDDALKIIEQGEEVTKELNDRDNDESNHDGVGKLQRARSIIQCLQE